MFEKSAKVFNGWNYPGIREESDTVETYYIGDKVKPGTDADCVCPH